MRYGIFTYGTRGETQPCIALALGLLEKGHQVTLAANENFKDFIEGYGINFHPLYGNIEEAMNGPEGQKGLKSRSTIALMRYFYKVLHENRVPIRASFIEGCKKVDRIIANKICWQYIDTMAEKYNKKYSLLSFMPPLIKTKEFPAPDLDFINKPWYNLLTYRFTNWAAWQILKKETNDFRKELGLPILNKSLIQEKKDRKIMNIHCFSQELIARPKDWEKQHEITGFLMLPKKKRENHQMDKIPEGLSTWLDAGEKPVYIGFGSMGIYDTEAFNRILMEILFKTNHRIIFCEGWSKIPNLPIHSNLFVVQHTNHQWLLPKCKTAVIHGGVGTLAAVLTAKIPVIITSFCIDQPTWGKIVAKKKIGVHIPFKQLTADKLKKAIDESQTPEMMKNASEIGEKINKEDGLKKAVDFIENYFA
jgi:sterol 3beta-glucosyltransferase